MKENSSKKFGRKKEIGMKNGLHAYHTILQKHDKLVCS